MTQTCLHNRATGVFLQASPGSFLSSHLPKGLTCSEELNFLRRGAPGDPGSSDSRPQILKHALLARPMGLDSGAGSMALRT